jgi:predicted ATPase
VGKDVPYPVLQAISDMPEAEIQRCLGHLQAAEFLYETKLFPNYEYTFKHALTHQLAYEGILQDRRRALHGHIVKSIERLHPDLPDEEVEGLANHAVRGELSEEAVTYHRRAGQRAVTRSANREAVRHFEQALAALDRLPASRQRLERSVDLQLEVRTPLWLLGEMERALASLRKAEQLARALGDNTRSGWVSAYLSNVFWMMDSHMRCVRTRRARNLPGTL